MDTPTFSPPRLRLALLNALAALAGIAILGGYGWLLVFRPHTADQMTAVFVIGANIVAILIHPQAGFLLWLFLIPYASFLPFDIHMPAGIPDLAFARTVGGFLTVYLLAQIARRQRRMMALTAVDLAIPLFALALILAALRSNLGWLTALQSAFDSYLVPLLAYFIARQLFQTRRQLRSLANVLLVAGAIVAALAISEQLFGVTLFRGTATQDFYSATGVRKVAALLGNPAYIAITLAVIIPLALTRALESASARGRGVYLLLVLFLEAGIYLTYNRSGWIGGLLAVLVLALLVPRLRRASLITIVAAGIIAVASWGLVQDTAVGQRITAESPIDYRVEALDYGLSIYRSNPILGVGYGSFGRIAARLGFRETGHVFVLPTPHNTYLNLLVSGGPLLLGGYLLLAGALALTLLQRARRLRGRGRAAPVYLLAGWACLAAFFVPSAGFDNNFAVYGNIVFWSIMGAILGVATSSIIDD